ncbi:alpha/beta hydrolase [Thermosynechococcus sp. HN-54]|uniref:alpha/beta hydrolase n=1 Tax=Thermosynechococcus sp. HN-54 TaxID=2933959 RepID=UPI00202CC326|nr:alpha/beta hydrolase [Thermosynechococcus sp. HN-54]URR36051.1 alpha/beta hydrolase [Thermosynechococcus sp. HN-54]
MSWLQDWILGEWSWLRLGRSALLIYLIIAVYLCFGVDALIFHPPRPTYSLSEEIRLIPVGWGDRLAVRYVANPEADFTLLFSHGNGEDLGMVEPFLERLRQWGFAVLAYDYRGYGLSSSTPTERHAYEDARAAYTYLTEELRVPPEQVILYGRSLGGGVATELATQVAIAGLVLESTFTSIFRVVVPFPLFPFDRLINRDKLPHVQAPVLILHGTADSIVPFSHGKHLFAIAREPKFALWVEGADHNDFVEVAGDRLRTALEEFATFLKAQSS